MLFCCPAQVLLAGPVYLLCILVVTGSQASPFYSELPLVGSHHTQEVMYSQCPGNYVFSPHPQPLSDWQRGIKVRPRASKENSFVLWFMFQSHPYRNKANVRTCLRSHPCLALSASLFCFIHSLIGFSSESIPLSLICTQTPVPGMGTREANLRESWYKYTNLCLDSTPRSHSCPSFLVCMFS